MSTPATSIDKTPVSKIMVQHVKTLREKQSVLDACRIMHENKIGSVVVVKENKAPPEQSASVEPIGIITERDIVKHIAVKLIGIQAPVQEVMSRPLITARPETSLADAIHIMQKGNFRRLVIVDNAGKMVGIVTDKDIFRTIAHNLSLISGILGEQPLPEGKMELIDMTKIEALRELLKPSLS